MSNIYGSLPAAYLPQSETARRLDAQGMLLHYQPRRYDANPYDLDNPESQSTADLSHLSWPAYKTANRFDTTDYVDKKRIWSAYRDQVIPQIAQATGESYEGLQQLFDQTYTHERPKQPKRSMLEAVGDTATAIASSAAQGIKTIPDLIDPTSSASRFLEESIIQPLERSQSVVIKDEKQRQKREVEEAKAEGGTGIAAALDYYLRNPLQAVATAIGAIAPFAATGGAATAAGLGVRARIAAQSLLSAGMGAGEVRGNMWDKIHHLSDQELIAASPEYAQLRQTMDEAQAKQVIGANLSRHLPELAGAAAIGGVTGSLGVQRTLAGLPTRSGRLGTALGETVQEAAQGGVEQLATNYGVKRGLPTQSLSEDVLLNAAREGALGGIAGGVVGGHHVTQHQPADLLASASPAKQPLALPAPTRYLPKPDVVANDQAVNFQRSSAYPVEPEDITAVLEKMPKIINRDFVARHLEADLRNGTLEETAKQKNSLGRAATALLARIEQHAQTKLLDAPEPTLSLPSPTDIDPSGDMVVDALGQAQQQTYEQAATARAGREESIRLGLTPDVLQAQYIRTHGSDNTESSDTTPSTEAEVPISKLSLPSPTNTDPSGAMAVDTLGQAQQQTYEQTATAQAMRKESIDLGLTPDVRKAQHIRKLRSDSPSLSGTTQPGLSVDALRQALTKESANQHIDLYPSLSEAPAHLQKQAKQIGAQDIEGFFDPKTNRVALIANNIRSPERALEVARHELIGHYGLENMVGQKTMLELAKKVATAERLGNKLFKKIATEVDRTQPNLDSETRAKEIVALMAEKNLHNHIVHRVLDSVRQFLKKAGLLKSNLTDTEVAKLLREAHRFVRERNTSQQQDVENDAVVAEKNKPVQFSRSGAASARSIPLAKNASLQSRIAELSQNKASIKAAAKTFLSQGGKAPQPKWLEDAVTMLFDDRNPLEQAVRRSGNTNEGKQFLHTLRTFEAAAQKTVHDFEQQKIEPMMGSLRQAWDKTFKKMDWYQTHGWRQFLMDIGTIGNLIKHGRERNQEIARKTNGKDNAGSGRTDQEIDTIERDLRQAAPGLIELYENMYQQHLKPMLDYRDQVLRDAGLLTAEMEQGRPNYQWYVPLFGDPNETEDSLSHYAASGKSLKNPQDKKAMGRSGTLANNLLQNVLETTQAAIQRAGMQSLKKDLITWVKANTKAKGLLSAKINEAGHKEIFEKYIGKDGLVHERVKSTAALSPDAVVLRDGNQTTILHIGNQKILDALKGVHRNAVDGVFALPAKATRLLSAIYTRYNPVFPLMNKLRDTQSQLSFLLADAPITNKATTVRKVLANNLRYSSEWRDKPGSEYQQWKEKYQNLGGTTLYSDLFTDDVMRNLEDSFAQMIGADSRYKLKAAATKVGDFIDRVNMHMETSSRVALFKGLVDAGMSEQEAVLYTKNTMNFEVKGKLGRQLGALYAFAGPALFDARRMAQALRTPQGAMVMLAHFALMYGLYGALKAMSGEDDDGIDKLNKVPLSQSGRFLTLIDADDPESKGWKFPVGFGFGRISLALAASLHRYMDGLDDTGEFVGNVAKEALLSNFNPLEPIDINPSKDLAGWAMQQFMPTIAKPLLQLAMNQTGQGSPIHKPDEWTGNKLKITQAWPQTSLLFKQAAKDIYEATGIDVYPETLQFLLRSYGGGGAMGAVRAVQLLGEKADTEIGLTDMPLAQAFTSKPLHHDMVRFREKFNTLQKLKSERDYAKAQGDLAEFDEAHPDVESQLALYKQANKEIKLIYKERKALNDDDAAQQQEKIKVINQRIRAVQMQVGKL